MFANIAPAALSSLMQIRSSVSGKCLNEDQPPDGRMLQYLFRAILSGDLWRLYSYVNYRSPCHTWNAD